jgi:hypothetical protein
MLGSLHRLSDQRARLEGLQGAVVLTRRFLDLEPWREEAHRRLMRWLALKEEWGWQAASGPAASLDPSALQKMDLPGSWQLPGR